MKIDLFKSKPIFLAPMEGVSNSVFRRVIAKNGGIDCVCTEFIRITGKPGSRSKLTKDLEKIDGIYLSVQLMGNEPEFFPETANILLEEGADLIDLNLGCPSKRVNKHGSGAALLGDLPRLTKIVRGIRNGIPNHTFSVKMRAGISGTENLFEILEILEGEGIDFLTIHPRTQKQSYTGKANKEIIAQVKDFVKIPVVGNGDICTSEEAKAMFEKTNCDGIMIGRGAMKNPLIFREAKEFFDNGVYQKSNDFEKLEILKNYANELVEYGFSERGTIGRVKEFSGFLCQGIGNGIDLKQRILRSQSLEEIFEIYDKNFEFREFTLQNQ
ncbi:MAG: tRNA-dihydrouridine synthase family protein [Calditrichaeota bacterium]|nr:MAG: tRNA-dihydrouridine synthase family protein [Calditrichota bacterium]